MAQIILEQDKRKVRDMNAYIIGRMAQEGITQAMMARHIGCTRQTFKNKLDNGGLIYKDLLMIFDKLDIPEEKILEFMQLRR